VGSADSRHVRGDGMKDTDGGFIGVEEMQATGDI
jgi:hypothetical protein